MPAADDHYAVLGVASDADLATIRRAWVRAARASHPDHQADAADQVRLDADERIRAVNEAWRVLGDTKLRRDHDRQLRRARPKPAVAHPVSDDGAHFDERLEFDIDTDGGRAPGFEVRSAGWATVLRTLPWVVVGALGIGIFVFTAFASSSRTQNEVASPTAPECVRIRANGTVQPVPCQWENDGVIDQFIPLDSDQACRHEDAMPHEAPRHNARLCLVPYEVLSR
ncbi:MAG: DnaJ domain-containing protein [Actinomycetota bacterium]|nr:DnaJ domain-containing protein [Actinomycetota bacterium]